MASFGAAYVRAMMLARSPAIIKHRPFTETVLHRAPACLHNGVLSTELLSATGQQAARLTVAKAGTTWLDAGQSPRTPIERAVRTLENLVAPSRGHAGCEWWVQSLEAGTD